MKPTVILVYLAMAIGACLPGDAKGGRQTSVADQARQPNVIVNGGFENKLEEWNWGQWKGLPVPGFLDREAPYKGRASFVMGLSGVQGTRSLTMTVPMDPTTDYELTLVLRGTRLPDDAIRVALLQWGTEKGTKIAPQGWVTLPDRPWARDLIVTGGTFDWKSFKVHIYRQSLKPTTTRQTLYIDHTAIGQGELGIDEVSLVPVAPIPYKKSPAGTARKSGHKRSAQASQAKPNVQTKQPRKPTVDATPRSAPTPRLLLLDRADTTSAWSLTLGKEFPGAAGTLQVETLDGRPVLKVQCNLSHGGRYVGVQRSLRDVSSAESLVFEIRCDGLIGHFTARVRDRTGQTCAAGLSVQPGEWETIELPLNTERFRSHWGGANDGTIYFPLRSVMIAATSSRREAGTFWLRNLAVKTKATANTWRVDVTTDRLGHIHFTNEPRVTVGAKMINRLRQPRRVSAVIQVLALNRHTIASTERSLQFAPWGVQSVSLPIDSPGPGYYGVRVSLGASGQQAGEGAFGVVPRPRRFGQRDPESFFAMHVNGDPQAAARIGVHWTRLFNMWQYSEYDRGLYTHHDKYIRPCLEAGIDVMMCLDYREPHWLKPRTDKDDLPTQQALRHYADWVRDAVRASPQVAVFEIQNEPNLELGTARRLPRERAVEFYAKLVETAVPIIRDEAPHARIAGCSVSGGDYNDGFAFSRLALKRVSRYLDIFAAHPYASPRTFGPGLQPAFPEDNREGQKHRAAVELLQEFDQPRPMWIGEKGWEIKDTAALFGDSSLAFANCLARSFVIARSAPGVKKYFWFMQQHENSPTGARYAIFRGHPVLQPMPGAVAYAQVAYRLDRARPSTSFSMADGEIRVYVFQRREDETAVAVLWSVGKPFVLSAQWPAGTRAWNLYGRTLRAGQNEDGQINLTGSPVFLETRSVDEEALTKAIKQASIKPGLPFQDVAASLIDLETVRLGLVNHTQSTLPLQSRVDGQTRRIILPAVAEPVWVELALNKPATTRGSRPVNITLKAEGVEPQHIAVNSDLLPVTHRSSIRVDGNGEDWQDVPVLAVKTREHIEPPDPAGWQGRTDLSLRARLAWNDRNLYLLVRVRDDKHVVPVDPSRMSGDRLRIALDMFNDARLTRGFDPNDRAYTVLLESNVMQTFRTHPSYSLDAINATGRRVGEETIYELAIPWTDLGREPEAGLVFSLNFVADEDDGAGYEYSMGLTSGFGQTNRPAQFREFYLAD